jgi:hypothetical protein
MKTKTILVSLFALAFFFSSCGSSKKGLSNGSNFYSNLYNGDEKFLEGRDSSLGNFIELKNGDKISGNEIRLKMKVFSAKFVVDGVEYDANEVMKMQNDFGYFERQFGTLMARLDRNPITLFKNYYIHEDRQTYGDATTNSRRTTVTKSIRPFYILVKDGESYTLRKKTLKFLIEDCEEALEMYNLRNKLSKKGKLISLTTLPIAVAGGFLVDKYNRAHNKYESGASTEKPKLATIIGGGVAIAGGLYGGQLIARKKLKGTIPTSFDIIAEYNYYTKKRLEKKKK